MRTNYLGKNNLLPQDMVTTEEGLRRFAEKVRVLKLAGLNRRNISERLGIARSTIDCRLAKWKKLNEKTTDHDRRSSAG